MRPGDSDPVGSAAERILSLLQFQQRTRRLAADLCRDLWNTKWWIRTRSLIQHKGRCLASRVAFNERDMHCTVSI
jgi:hypothetical protein